MPPHTPLLDTVQFPADTRKLTAPELRQLAEEVRAEMIDAVSTTGGHLGSGLGVVELTVALHHVFETPKDIVIWDNRCTMHSAVADYKALGDRYMHRTTVKGDRPH